MSSWRYKRVVIGLPQGLGNLSAAQAAVDFAEFLQLELLAAFITDAALFALADFPAVRELRIFDQQWQPLDVPRISRELEDAATIARKRFDESIASRTVKAAFDVLSGVEAIPALLRAGDIPSPLSNPPTQARASPGNSPLSLMPHSRPRPPFSLFPDASLAPAAPLWRWPAALMTPTFALRFRLRLRRRAVASSLPRPALCCRLKLLPKRNGSAYRSNSWLPARRTPLRRRRFSWHPNRESGFGSSRASSWTVRLGSSRCCTGCRCLPSNPNTRRWRKQDRRAVRKARTANSHSRIIIVLTNNMRNRL